MKYLFLLMIACFIFVPAWAAETESSPSATPTAVVNKKVEDLKDRIATKVAQLSQSERRAVYGTVKTTSISTLTVETVSKNLKIELTEDIKVFQNLKGKRTALTIEDVTKGDTVTVFGTWDTAVEVLNAKVICIQSTADASRKSIGTITDVKKSDYTLSIQTDDKKDYTIDFETFTKTSVVGNDGKSIEKGGFSKLVAGDLVLIDGIDVPKKESRISANRILVLGNVSGMKPSPSPTTEEKEATGSSTKPSISPTKSPAP